MAESKTRPIMVTLRCGCGFMASATARTGESHHDAWDHVQRLYDQHITDAEEDGICRPWAGRSNTLVPHG